jgi:hypothetical protein
MEKLNSRTPQGFKSGIISTTYPATGIFEEQQHEATHSADAADRRWANGA